MEGSGLTPLLVLSMLERLPIGSMTRSLMQSEDEWSEFLDRGPDWYLLADVFDATNQQTRVTGNWAKKPPKFDPYPRPGASVKARKPKSLADVHRGFGGATAPSEGSLWGTH